MIRTWDPQRLSLLVACLSAASGLLLSVSLRFPEVLLDDPSFGASLVAAHPVAAVAGLLGLLASGLLLPVLSHSLASGKREGGEHAVFILGWAGGLCWVASAVVGLILVPLWGTDVAAGLPMLAWIAFGSVAVVAPLVLAAWTVALVGRSGHGRLTGGTLGAVGLLLTFARSMVWALNTGLPAGGGFYVLSAILTVLALLGFPTWLYWLARTGIVHSRVDCDGCPSAGRRLGAGLVGVVVVLAHAGLVTATTPTPETDDVPAVPSAGGAAFYVLMLALAEELALPTDHASLLQVRRDDRYTRPEVPSGATLDEVDADGVAAERVCAGGAAEDRAVLYLHGGGFVLPMSNGHRQFAATVSRATGVCVLLPRYRIAPEHPFPAAVQDSVRAYRWLGQQGIAASRIVIMGDSSGGTLALSTVVSLRDSGQELPAAVVALSAGTDLTLSGETHRTKAGADPLLSRDDVAFSVRSYTGEGAVDPRDSLVSPLYAEASGVPPVLLLVGSQEVLLSDSIRMADRLRRDGVPVRLEVWAGMPHDWPLIASEIMEAELALEHIAIFVSRCVGSAPKRCTTVP